MFTIGMVGTLNYQADLLDRLGRLDEAQVAPGRGRCASATRTKPSGCGARDNDASSVNYFPPVRVGKGLDFSAVTGPPPANWLRLAASRALLA